MQAQVYEGYFDNGKFYTHDNKLIRFPKSGKASFTLYDERKDKKAETTAPAKRPVSDLLGCMKGEIWMSDDFDEPLEEVREYMVVTNGN
jgi:hypothetical protein